MSIGPSDETSSFSSERARSKSLVVHASKKHSATSATPLILHSACRSMGRPRPYEQLDRAAMVQRPRSISRTLETTDRWVRAASREDMVAVRRRPRRADRATYELVATQELSRNGTAERVQHL